MRQPKFQYEHDEKGAGMSEHGETLAVGTVATWAGDVRVSASESGVRDVWLPRWDDECPPATQIEDAIIQRADSSTAEQHLRLALDELSAFFAGTLRVFTVPLDLRGPAFFARAWEAVARVPYGETRTYGEIACELGAPAATRAVGAANGANPGAPFVPCHRVLGSDGRLTGYGPGLPMKQALLLMEDAIPANASDYDAWVARVTGRMRAEGVATWYLGVRKLGVYCRPDCTKGGAARLAPNRLLRSPDEAARADFRPCPACQPETTSARAPMSAGAPAPKSQLASSVRA